MTTTLSELDAAIAEAELIRARHEGVHAVHGLVMAVHFCRELYAAGDWCPQTAHTYRCAMHRLRYVDRTGFLPGGRADFATGGERELGYGTYVSAVMGRSLSVAH